MPTETMEHVTNEEVRHFIAAARTEEFFNLVNNAINQVNAPYASGLPIKYGFKFAEQERERLKMA
jgi:hypothetical protein